MVAQRRQIDTTNTNPTLAQADPGAAGSSASKSKSQSGDTSSAAAAPSDQAALKKLIVGTWQGGSANDAELILQKDGTYSAFYSNIVSYHPPSGGMLAGGNPKPINETGHWHIQDSALSLSGEFEIPKLRGLATPELVVPEQILVARKFKIVRLDESLLRLEAIEKQTARQLGIENAMNVREFARGGGRRGDGDNLATLFFHRNSDNPSSQDFDPAFPKELVRWAELMRLTPKEASDLRDLFERLHVDSMHPDILERITKARGKNRFFRIVRTDIAGSPGL